MQKKDYYYLKDIILGLKSEYLKCYQELEKLKQFVSITNEKMVKDFHFILFKLYPTDDVTLLCNIVKRKNMLKKLLENIQSKIGMYAYDIIHECKFNDNNEMVISNDKIGIFGNTPEFCSQIKLIKDLPFTNNIAVKFLHPIKNSENAYTRITHNRIYYMNTIDSEKHIILNYHPVNNLILLDKYDENFNEELLYSILYSKYSRNELSKYHQNIIDSSDVASKVVKVMDIPEKKENNCFEDMELEEHSTTVLLKRKLK